MRNAIGFLEELERNNNREWFQAHKSDYLAAQKEFDALAAQLIAGIACFDKRIEGLGTKDCTYRIYRDTRFSNDKSPYKTHIGAFICPGGKKSGYAGYYFQIGPEEDGYPAGCMLAAGHYMMEKQALRTLREDICNGEGDFERVLRQARPFRLDEAEDYTRRAVEASAMTDDIDMVFYAVTTAGAILQRNGKAEEAATMLRPAIRKARSQQKEEHHD